jgi:Protein tyrosine and serine/threonine kinase
MRDGETGRAGLRLRMAFVLDVAGYGARGIAHQQEVQRRLRRLVEAMLDGSGLKLDPEVVEHQWTGDGINAVLPADIDPTVILPLLIRSLASALGADNAQSADRIRLRMAVSAGLIRRSVAGFSGQLIMDISRLVDSSALHEALAAAPEADLAVAISDHVYAMVVRPGYQGIPDGQFSRVKVVAKEFSAAAWVWLSARQWSEPAYRPLTPDDPADVGGYRVYARLGGGAAGPVYLGAGEPGSAPEWAAVKVFDRALSADADVRRRLAAGALAASVLPDPHLVPVIASDTAAVRPWTVSTLVRGPSLADAVTQTGPLPPAAVGWTALGLARAIATLHRAELTHHAVTAGNVLLDDHGPMLTDFGVNRAALAHGPGSFAEDVFQLGCTVCYAATGRPPWSDWPAGSPPLSSGDLDLADCPAELTPIVAACLAADPQARPSADRLVGWLATVAGQRPRSWLPDAVAARLRDYQELPPLSGPLAPLAPLRPASWPRFRRPR